MIAMRRFMTRLAGPSAFFGLITLSLCAARTARPPKEAKPEALNPSEEQHVVEAGDTLWDICDALTGKPWAWPQVWAMNPEIVNPHWIYPGDIVRFTQPTEAPPARADLVASSSDAEAAESIAAPAQPEEVKKPDVPKVEVIRTAAKPAKEKREYLQRVFQGSFVGSKEVHEAGKLTNAMPDQMMLQPGDEVYITTPRGHRTTQGERFLIYRTVRDISHPTTGQRVGYMTEITGTLTVIALDGDVSRAQINTIYMEVERGQLLMPMADLGATISSIAPKKKVNGVVVAVEGDHPSVGEQKLVFIDRGKKDGLERGTELRVRGEGDPVIKASRGLPELDIATLLVVEARDTNSTCVVVDALHEIGPGALVYASLSAAERPIKPAAAAKPPAAPGAVAPKPQSKSKAP